MAKCLDIGKQMLLVSEKFCCFTLQNIQEVINREKKHESNEYSLKRAPQNCCQNICFNPRLSRYSQACSEGVRVRCSKEAFGEETGQQGGLAGGRLALGQGSIVRVGGGQLHRIGIKNLCTLSLITSVNNSIFQQTGE